MQTKVIERVSKETLTQLLPEIVPGLIQVRREERRKIEGEKTKQTNKKKPYTYELQRLFRNSTTWFS